MNTYARPRRVPASFGREARFDIALRFGSLERQRAVERLKNRMLDPLLDNTDDHAFRRQLRLAANEAAAIAWMTPFPLLVFPALFEEKADEVRHYVARQEEVQNATEAMVEAVA